MRTISTLFCIVCLHCALHAQYSDYLHINDVKALFNANGFMFTTPAPMQAEYAVPYLGPPYIQKSSLFASNLWLAGIDAGEQLHVAAQTYRQSGDDFWPGPIANDYTDLDYITKYNSVWKIDASAVEAHILLWNTAGYIVPDQIANWPGNGNVDNGEAAQLAPYYDHNNNLVYDPENGDYPIIRGDQAVFMIYNDVAEDHSVTGGMPLGAEVHMMAYALNTPYDSALYKTVFLNVRIINRSAENYSECILGMFNDFDIGAFDDDFIGSDTLLNMYYGYNADLNDGPTSPNYSEYPPAQGVIFLNSPMQGFTYFSNDFSVTGNPVVAADYWNYLIGNWKDGTPLTYGGNGYGGVLPTSWMYTGHPLDNTSWSELSVSNVPYDRKGLGSTNLGPLNSGDTACVDIALLTAFSYSPIVFGGVTSNLYPFNAVQLLKERTIGVQFHYDTYYPDCMIQYTANPDLLPLTEFMASSGFTLYPNPASDHVLIKTDMPAADVMECIVMNAGGQIVLTPDPRSACSTGISTMDLPSGLYSIRLSKPDGQCFVESFIKQ